MSVIPGEECLNASISLSNCHVNNKCTLRYGIIQHKLKIFTSFYESSEFVAAGYCCSNMVTCHTLLVVQIIMSVIYRPLISPFFVWVNLLAGKCNLAISGRGARVFWSNPLTQTYPAILIFFYIKKKIENEQILKRVPQKRGIAINQKWIFGTFVYCLVLRKIYHNVYFLQKER